MLGWCIDQSIIRYPNVLTASEIVRQLGVAKSTGTMLKRRLQLWGLQHKEVIRKLMYEELQERYGNKRKLPQKDYQNLDLDVTRWLRDKRVPQADTVVLYSTRPNATGNKRRKRHHGQVASIFRADSLGGDQVGTMLQCVTWKAEPGRGAPAIYDSISNQRAETLIPLLDKTIPKNCPFFTDYGYKFYVRHNKNHRMVNHSLPARRGKGKSRRRWSQCSVHTQVVEGRQGALKTAFRQYRYIKPRYSELYLGEYSLWSALKYYGVETIASAGRESRPDRVLSGGVDSGEKKELPSDQAISSQIEVDLFKPPTLEERQELSPVQRSIAVNKAYLNQGDIPDILKSAIRKHIDFWSGPTITHRRRKEKRYDFLAKELWDLLPTNSFATLGDLCREHNLPKRPLMRVVLQWNYLGLIKAVDRTILSSENKELIYDIQRTSDKLPNLLYLIPASDQVRILREWKAALETNYTRPNKQPRRRKYEERWENQEEDQ